MKKSEQEQKSLSRQGEQPAESHAVKSGASGAISVQRDAILAALRRGPVLRQLPMSQKPFGLLMAVDHLRHGGSLASLAAAGLARSLYLAVVLVALVGALGATGIWWATATPAPVYHGVGLCLSPPLLMPGGAYHLEIQEVLPNTPAARAGLVPGDRILAVNGETVTVAPRPQFRGAPGTLLTLTVQRAGESTTEQVILTRAEIPEALYQGARERNPYADALAHSSQL